MTDPNTIEGAISALNEVANAHQSLQSQFQGKQNEIEQNNQAMQDWQTQLGTVDFINPDGSVRTVKTLRQLMADAQMQIDETHPHPYAMRKSTFEAIRAVNKEMFAASGLIHYGKHRNNGTNLLNINDGLYAITTVPNILALGCGSLYATGNNKSKSDSPQINVAGVNFELNAVNGNYESLIVKFPPAEDGTRTFDSTTGISTKHSSPEVAFASETETNKVVTDRVDMWGLEAFLREINADDPFVYKFGLIQSKAVNIDGVETETDMVRPATYFAWYEGDDSRRGDGVNWLSASESERAKIARNPQNNIYFDDATGKFYQWCVRGRSFAGAGNGDWLWLDYKDPVLKSTMLNSVVPLGALNGKPSFTGNGSDVSTNEIYVGDYRDYQGSHEVIGLGHFTLRNSPDTNQRAVNRECYFLVCGTVSRLNQGCYHPSFNSFGTKLCQNFDTASLGQGSPWHQTDNKPTTRAECFGEKMRLASGSLESPYSGRPDGRYYDAIYAEGLGGVCRDMRYSAWGLTAEDFAEADLKVKSGKYCGSERLGITKVGKVTVTGNAVYSGGYTRLLTSGQRYSSEFADWDGYDITASGAADLDGCFVVGASGAAYPLGSVGIRINTNAATYVSQSAGDVSSEFPTGEYYVIILRKDLQPSAAGEYIQTEVVAHPAELLLCADLKDGWAGGWNPTIPDGQIDLYKLSKPYSGSGADVKRTHTRDNGTSWASGSISLSDPAVNGTQFTNMPANQVTIYQYKIKAKVTKPANNVAVYGGRGGVGDVWSVAFYASTWGRTLAYSLIGKVLTGANSGGELSPSNTLLSYSLSPEGILDPTSSREASHVPLNLHAQLSPGVKALGYHVVDNNQGYINYAYTELIYDHTANDWGDDGKIHIVNNQATMPDDNGNKVLVGTAQLIEPLGWIKNDK